MTNPSPSGNSAPRDSRVGGGYIPAVKKHPFVPADPRDAARAPTDFRTIIATVLWGMGVLLALLGNWLRWEWLTGPAPLPYPDQVWGDLASGSWENLLVLVSLGLAILVGSLRWLTGWSRPPHHKPAWLYRLADAVKWLAALVSGGALVAMSVLAFRSLGDWWIIFPGWIGQSFAQGCILVGAVLLPSASNPHRNAERENHPRAWSLAATLVVFAFALPWGVMAVVDWTQQASKFEFVRDPNLEIVAVTNPGPFGSAGAAATTASGQLAWERLWKGAREPALVESVGGGTIAVRMFQATPNRDALVLLDRRTGQTRIAMSENDIARRHLGLMENPNYTRLTFTYGNTMLRAGSASEWVTNQGRRLTRPPQNTVEETNSFKIPVDGVHATDLLRGTSWFIGDSGSCDRRLLTADSAPIAAPSGTFVMYQVCDASAQNIQDWAFPEALLPFTEPLTVTLFGVNPQSGAVAWVEPLPGWDMYLRQNPTDFPSGLWHEIPFEVALAQPETDDDPTEGNFTVSIDGFTSDFNAATGLQ